MKKRFIEKIHFNINLGALGGWPACGTHNRKMLTINESELTCGNCKKWVHRRRVELKTYD